MKAIVQIEIEKTSYTEPHLDAQAKEIVRTVRVLGVTVFRMTAKVS